MNINPDEFAGATRNVLPGMKVLIKADGDDGWIVGKCLCITEKVCVVEISDLSHLKSSAKGCGDPKGINLVVNSLSDSTQWPPVLPAWAALSDSEKRAALGKPEAKEPAPPASELLPCPFCGSWPVFHKAHCNDSISLTCPNADCSAYRIAHHHESRKQAIAAWNRRAPSQPDAVAKAALAFAEADRRYREHITQQAYEKVFSAREVYRATKAVQS